MKVLLPLCKINITPYSKYICFKKLNLLCFQYFQTSLVIQIVKQFCFDFYFVLFYLPYLSSTRKRIVLLYFGQEVRTRLGVAFFEVYEPPVFHIKVGHPVKCLAQGHNKQTCQLVLHNLPKMPSTKQESC